MQKISRVRCGADLARQSQRQVIGGYAIFRHNYTPGQVICVSLSTQMDGQQVGADICAVAYDHESMHFRRSAIQLSNTVFSCESMSFYELTSIRNRTAML